MLLIINPPFTGGGSLGVKDSQTDNAMIEVINDGSLEDIAWDASDSRGAGFAHMPTKDKASPV